MLNLLAIVPKDDGNWYFDNYGEPFLYALIGFAIVFLGIVLIIFIIWLLGLLMRKTNNLAFLSKISFKRKKKVQESETPAAISYEEGEIPDEVKAAIIAAVMAYYQSEQPQCEFKVKRIKRI